MMYIQKPVWYNYGEEIEFVYDSIKINFKMKG